MASTTMIICFLLPNIVVLALAIKVIFKNSDAFNKSIGDHFWPDDIALNPLDNRSEKNNAKHKMNILYAVALLLAMLNIAAYQLFF